MAYQTHALAELYDAGAARRAQPVVYDRGSAVCALASRLGVAPSAVLLTLVGVAFARVFDRDELVIGVCQPRQDRRHGVEFFADRRCAPVLPFRFFLAPEACLAETIRSTSVLFDVDAARGPDMSREVGEDAGAIGFDVTLNCRSAHDPMVVPSGNWHIDICGAEGDEPLAVTLWADPAGSSQLLGRGLGEALKCVLRDCGTSLGIAVGALAILPADREEALLARAAGPAAALPETPALPALIAAQAVRTPHAVAVEDADEALDYEGLLARAGALAAALAGAGVGAGTIVGLALPRGVDMIVAVLAVQQAGAAFLPLDLNQPRERLAFMLFDAAAMLVLVCGSTEALIAKSIPVLRVDRPLPRKRGVPLAAGPDDLAYLLYTSGSTGQPKAVAVTQRSIANLALWGAAMLGPRACAGMLFSTALVFDVGLFELFSPLVSGGRVLVIENLPALGSSRLRKQVRVVSGCPTVLEATFRTGSIPEAVECVVAAGEVLTRGLADRLFAARPGLRLVNAYGPTEGTVFASWAEIEPASREAPPIGRAIANMALYVLDRAGRLLPEGATGELCLGGAGVASGYLHRPELNAERFIANPFGAGRLYRTGDSARWLTDRDLEFLGRRDSQVKLHGMRIEAGEVESALRTLPGVAAAAVGVQGFGEEARLVAWIVPDSAPPAPAALRQGLAQMLPQQMVPAAIMFLAELPVSVSGKLDRTALPLVAAAGAGNGERRKPSTPMQQAVFDLWRSVVEIPAIQSGDFGIDDDLFDLGGDSLSAMLVGAAIEAEFGASVEEDIDVHGFTVGRMAAVLGMRGVTMSVHLLVDGERVFPETVSETEFLFRLRLPAREIRLVSRAARPVDLGIAEDDRTLGVRIADLVWEQGEARLPLSLSAPMLGEGFYPCEASGKCWTNGDAWLAENLIPPWQGRARLRLRAWVLQPGAPMARSQPENVWLSEFESLGENCEFGFVQQHFEIRQPLSLLRWAGTDHLRLLKGLLDGFGALEDPAQIKVVPGKPDYMLETPYATLHTFQLPTAQEPGQQDEMHQRGAAAVGFLRRSLLRDIAEARKIFVFQTAAPEFNEIKVRRMHAALRRHGPAALLCVTQARPGTPAGTVTRLADGLYLGRVSRFVLEAGPYEEWLGICRRTLMLHRRYKRD